ncbi:glycoside hydrolase family 2 TIM barrel-domain containing protein [Cesiribacter andamanensis]|uniref:glycoside hydrolase family 2 TIM barrel-domain containing protein n=1 Tax=Cesiribacter andamanensis TaxID=649507 RepID=UPI00034C24DA|nr:glycoside hydrolase family 2 TIM barrel-domain containing protein [Cesiribacter andamanensis]
MLLTLLFLASCQGEPLATNPAVEVRKEGDRYVLYRHGSPYFIKGAAGDAYLDKIAQYGGNSIRTWNTREAGRILDEAAQYGLTVTLGLEVGNEWWGDDFSYWDGDAVDEKIEELRKVVEQYKDHPALLMWGVGNEVHLFGGNQIMVLRTIDRIAKMIKETDPNHPVMTAVPLGPNFKRRGLMRLLCPNVDVLGVNGFKRLPLLQEEIRDTFGWNKAYLLSEWGPVGPWESPTTDWGAPIEESSSRKAQLMSYYWDVTTRDTTHFVGGYAFYWGNKYERTYSFYSLFSPEGYETESVQVLQQIWLGIEHQNYNQHLRVDSLHINSTIANSNLYLRSKSVNIAYIFIHAPVDHHLEYCWEIRPEGLDNFKPGEFNTVLDYLVEEQNGPSVRFVAPEREGGYRLIVWVFDGLQYVATHNVPFYVIVP